MIKKTQLEDVEEYARMAFAGTLEAHERIGNIERELRRDIVSLQERMLEAEENPGSYRTSMVSAEFESKVLEVLKQKESQAPESASELKTSSGNRVRAPTWGIIVILILVLLITAVWKVDASTLEKLLVRK